MSKANLIDKIVMYLSPQSGVERIKARIASDIVSKHHAKRHFEGGSVGRRTSGWFTPSTSANGALSPYIHRMRDRARDLVRNNPYASGGIQSVVANVVGYGIMASVKDKSEARAKKIQERWKKWADTTACDFDDQMNFYGLQALAFSTIIESGEVLVRRRRVKMKDENDIPLKLQILEPDFLDIAKDGPLENGNFCIQGIEFNSEGQRVAYWLFEQHPGERLLVINKGYRSNRVPEADIIHCYKKSRAGQARGVTWFAPVMVRLQDLDEMMDATVVKQKVAAAFAAFVKDIDGTNEGGKFAINEKIEPGAIELLPPGRDISFPSPPSANDFDPFVTSILRSIAKGFGSTYESFTGDYSKVNYSSARAGSIDFGRNVDSWRYNLFIPGFCDKSFSWFKETLFLMGEAVDSCYVEWTPPRREVVDPTKEYPAMNLAVRSGFKSWSEVARENGYDPKSLIKELAEDNKMLDEAKLTLDCDARKTTKAGLMQPDPSKPSPNQPSGQPEDDTEEEEDDDTEQD